MMRAALLVLLLCLTLPSQAQWHSDSWDSMGTRAALEFWHQGEQSDAIISAIQAEFNRIEQRFSPWIENSELASFNRLPANQSMRSEEHTSELQSRPHLVC